MTPLASYSGKGKLKQFVISVITTLVVSVICYFVSGYIGYRAVALILLFTVSLLAIILSVYPVLVSAVLSALIWDFFFIPPYFTFHVERTEDVLMLAMYFIIALLNGILTSRIRHFEKQARQRELRLQSLKLYNALFNSISHELRTPITTIMGASENLISNKKVIQEKDREMLLDEIFKASARLNRLVSNLLNMSRLESGLLQPKFDWCDVSELVHTVINRLKPEMTNHPVTIKIPEDIPFVRMDFGLIEQALHSILHNVPVHTPPGTRVSIQADCRKNTLELVISDDGPGFQDEDLEMVFEKFYRTSSSGTGGLGLGLSIARGFIIAHNGTIVVANRKPHGAVFTIRIPVETTQIENENE